MYKEVNVNRAKLLISCPEKPGIISAVSNLLLENKANIVHFDQHTTDPQAGMFFTRTEFDLHDFDSSFTKLEEDLHVLSQDYTMDWNLSSNKKEKEWLSSYRKWIIASWSLFGVGNLMSFQWTFH